MRPPFGTSATFDFDQPLTGVPVLRRCLTHVVEDREAFPKIFIRYWLQMGFGDTRATAIRGARTGSGC